MPLFHINIALLPSEIDQSTIRRSGCVVIDMLRFTTSATQALAAGAKSIQVAPSIEVAQELASQSQSASRPLLCGERHCKRIPGFDFGNSPLEFTPSSVAGRDLIFTTTNGTVAAQATVGCKLCLLGALVNCSAIVSKIIASGIDQWWIVCAGTNGYTAFEDAFVANAIVDRLRETLGDQSLRINAWQIRRPDDWPEFEKDLVKLPARLQRSQGGRQLVAAGYTDDIHFACQLDMLDVIPSRNMGETEFRLKK